MFKWISATLGAGVLGLGFWLWWQFSEIDSLKTTNQAQAQTITELQQVQRHLEIALKQEQQANERQQKLANQLKKKSEQAREKVKVIFRDSPCANTALPDGVVEQLQ